MKTTNLTSWHFALFLAAVVLFLSDRNGPSAPQTEYPVPSCQDYVSRSAGDTSAMIRVLENERPTILTTAAEERNAESLLIIHSTGLASHSTDNWRQRRNHSSSFYPQHPR